MNGQTFYLVPVTAWPASDPLVTAVGGTKLKLDASGNRTSPDTVWNDTYNAARQRVHLRQNGPIALAGGGGKSVFFSRPPTRAPWTAWSAAAACPDSR